MVSTLADLKARNDIRIVGPQPGPQWEFSASAADIVIYGGQAGGGKSYGLLLDPLKNIGVPGFRGAIFRRTFPQLKGQGGIWDEALQLYPAFGGRMREGQELDATFPSGASVQFCHLQHEKTKYEYMGHQFAFIGFDELTHFSREQFFYLLSRNRSTCGIRPRCRCTCNPDAGSWVADFIAWWINQETGYPLHDRSGLVRYLVIENDQFHWADSPDDLISLFPQYTKEEILSVTFIPASLSDNPALTSRDPAYRGKLKALPRIERERLEGGNWKVRPGAIIERDWLKRYVLKNAHYNGTLHCSDFVIAQPHCRRFATVDTAGTSKERVKVDRGDPPSASVCAVWDYWHKLDLLFLVHVWRGMVEWNELKVRVPQVLKSWNVPLVVIEDAHYGKPLASEIKGIRIEMASTAISGMDDTSRGAKLERAIASGLLTRIEDGKIFFPQEGSTLWIAEYIRELTVWTGRPKETADQIDVSSHAAKYCSSLRATWGGVI